MKLRLIFSVFMTITLFAFGSALALEISFINEDYLALGDSVAFGYIDQAGYEYFHPTNFVPYADYLGFYLNLNVVDASCPGETTSSFLSLTGADNGCRFYRSLVPLHVYYSHTQRAFAKKFLKHHRNTRLVTISLGANDLFLLEKKCNYDPVCIAEGAPQLFATVAANMHSILADLRTIGYNGLIIIVNYYSLDYSDQGATAMTQGLNQAISAPASLYGAEIADVFSAFETAVSNSFAKREGLCRWFAKRQ